MRCARDQLRATPLLEGAVSGYISVDQPMQSSSHQDVTPREGGGSLIFLTNVLTAALCSSRVEKNPEMLLKPLTGLSTIRRARSLFFWGPKIDRYRSRRERNPTSCYYPSPRPN
jgi:hypothetical protein